MSLFDWLKRVLGVSKPPARDVSRLQPIPKRPLSGQVSPPQASDADEVLETVQTAIVPLKEAHRRLAYRDKRLLPKAKPGVAARLVRRKKPHVMDKEEAARLFSPTLRTRNRNLRDLLCDEQQLERLGLPVWQCERELADALEIPLKRLQHLAIHSPRQRKQHYVMFTIPKRDGSPRVIMAPKRHLKVVLRNLNGMLVSKLPVSEHAHGFRRGRSVRSNAEPHIGKRVVVRLDIQDFFATVHFGRVRGLLIAYGYSYPVATTLAVLMTEATRQPVEHDGVIYQVAVGSRYCVQGAPTSPGLCNAVVLRMDRRLAGLARKMGFAYTRYADDMIFSGDDPDAVKRLVRHVGAIVKAEGFALNTEKTRVMHQARRQRVTGVVVNKVAGLSRQERRNLRAAIHQAGKAGRPLSAELQGKLAYLHMLNPDQAAALGG